MIIQLGLCGAYIIERTADLCLTTYIFYLPFVQSNC